MTGLCFVDTNVLIYVRDSRDLPKMQRAALWIDRLWRKRAAAVSHQILVEYYNAVRTRLKPGLSDLEARLDVRAFLDWTVVHPDRQLYEVAFHLQDRYRFSWWDSLMVAAAKCGSCAHLLTEDLHHGQRIDGLTIINPFRADPEAVLA